MSMRDYAVDDYGLLLNDDHLEALASQLCDGYTAEDYSENMYDYIDELQDKVGLSYITAFTGGALIVGDDGESEYTDSQDYDEDQIYYLPLGKYPSLFRAAYENVDEVIAEVKETLGEYLPDNFPYRDNIRHIVGTTYG